MFVCFSVDCLMSQQYASVSQGWTCSDNYMFVCLSVDCLMSQQQASVSQRRTCSDNYMYVCLSVDCLMSQQQASLSKGWTCSDNCAYCHTEIKVADQTFYLVQSQHTDTREKPVPLLTLYCQTPDRVATGVPILWSPV